MSYKTVEEKKHLARVAQLPCCVCRFEEVELHHIRHGLGLSQRASHYDTLPICFRHHRGADGIHTLGTRKWERLYGEQTEHLKRTREQLGLVDA